MVGEVHSAREPGIGEITRLLQNMREGNPEAEGELLSHVYRELRALAASKMAQEAPGHTLQPTALVHEAWLRLAAGNGQHFPDRAYFFAAAGQAMRRILVENARRKKRLKHGGTLEKVDLEHVDLAAPVPDDELLEVDETLTALAKCQPRAAEVVNLLFFVGMTHEQAAKELGVSVSTVERTWAFARAWLSREIERRRSDQDKQSANHLWRSYSYFHIRSCCGPFRKTIRSSEPDLHITGDATIDIYNEPGGRPRANWPATPLADSVTSAPGCASTTRSGRE